MGVAGLGSEAKFRYRHDEVLRHALSVHVHRAKIAVRQDIPLGCREAIPFERLGVVLLDPSAAFISDREIVLRARVTLFGAAPIPLCNRSVSFSIPG